ncbi:MAG TPA: transcriptional activator RfaH [Candidatus Paceibacterota bacterium]|nr:transcriptional activator RfaH [Candidatus Paceibacterota bacterium]
MNGNLDTAWYCARTKPKHEHIAAANLVKHLSVEVFNPRLRVERATRRGLVRLVEPLFPCYVFIHCQPQLWNDVRHVNGISSLVHFGGIIPTVPDLVIEDLKRCFETDEPLPVQDPLLPGSEVTIAEGSFRGFQAVVLKTLPSKHRVQVLLEILGRPTVVEVGRNTVTVENRSLAASMPLLAAVA